LIADRDHISYFFLAVLAAAGFALATGFFFAAGADTPKTDSFSALAGVKRSPCRNFDLFTSGGIAPNPGCELALAENAQAAEPNRAFLLQCAHHQRVQFIQSQLRVLLLMPTVLTKCSITCDCVILNLEGPLNAWSSGHNYESTG
jgi:hypothetical protein